MSDYLASLLARYQPETPVITPRLPSLFEPEQPAIGRVPAWEGGIQDQEPVVQKSDARREIPLSPPFAKGEAGQHSVSPYRSKVKPPSFAKGRSAAMERLGGVGGGFSSSEADAEPPYSTARPIVPCKPIPAAPTALSVPIQPVSAPAVVMPQTHVPSAVKLKDAPSTLRDAAVKPTAKSKHRQQDNRPETLPPLARPVIPNAPVVPPVPVTQPQQPAVVKPAVNTNQAQQPIVPAVPVIQPQPLAAAKPAVNANQTQATVVPPAFRIEPKIPSVERNGIMTAPAIPAFTQPEPPPPQPEPVINVTIGRIEVRATVSTPLPKSKASNRPPVMGLDEYLRQRGGKSS